MTGEVGPDCLFKAVGRQQSRLDIGSSSQPSSSAISMLGKLCPFVLHAAGASRGRELQKGAETIRDEALRETHLLSLSPCPS